MEIAGKDVVGRAPESRHFVPLIVQPRELSERSDSSSSSLPGDKAGGEQGAAGGKTAATPKTDLVVIASKRVNEAAAWISAKVVATLRRGAEDVGEYVLDTFFSGDPDLAKSKNPHKNASFRALVDMCGTPALPVSKTWLNNAVGVAVMLRRLPEAAVFKQLPPSYRETLLPLRDPSKVEQVARQAAAKDLSFRELRQVVADERAKTPKDDSRGRPPIPVVLRNLNCSLKLLVFGRNRRSFSKAQIEELDHKQRRNAKAATEELVRKLRDLISNLK
jgi:hypothetical protein